MFLSVFFPLFIWEPATSRHDVEECMWKIKTRRLVYRYNSKCKWTCVSDTYMLRTVSQCFLLSFRVLTNSVKFQKIWRVLETRIMPLRLRLSQLTWKSICFAHFHKISGASFPKCWKIYEIQPQIAQWLQYRIRAVLSTRPQARGG